MPHKASVTSSYSPKTTTLPSMFVNPFLLARIASKNFNITITTSGNTASPPNLPRSTILRFEGTIVHRPLVVP